MLNEKMERLPSCRDLRDTCISVYQLTVLLVPSWEGHAEGHQGPSYVDGRQEEGQGSLKNETILLN